MTAADASCANGRPLRVAFLTIDNREHFKDYSNPQPFFGAAPEALLNGFNLQADQVEVHVISCFQRSPVSSPDKLAKNIFYHALHVRNIGWMKTGYQGCIRAIHSKLGEIRPDVVHGQGTERECALGAVLSGHPNVMTIHGHMSQIADITRAKPLTYYWLAKKLERFCVRRTGGVICLNSYTERMVAPYARRFWTIPNAVHQSFFDVVRSPTKPARVLCVANVHPWKNQIGLIEAMEPLRATFEFELIFSGSGNPSHPYYQQFSRMVSDRPWCRYLGSLGRESLQIQISQAALGVLPSFEDNCPMVVLEAAAAGLPFAASNIGGIPDLVEHGRTGVLFDPNDAADISRTIGKLLGNRAQQEAMAKLAKTLCRERSYGASVARRHIEIYRAVIAAD